MPPKPKAKPPAPSIEFPPLRIYKAIIKNVKGALDIELTLHPYLNRITGANGAGKSSIFDAIEWGMVTKRDQQEVPVTTGAPGALTELDLGSLVVRREWNASGDSEVYVESKDKARYQNARALLDGLYSELTFDASRFDSLDKHERFDFLADLVGVRKEYERLGLDIGVAEESRRRSREELERAERVLESMPEIDPNVQREDIAALLVERRSMEDDNGAIRRTIAERDHAAHNAEVFRSEAAAKRAKAHELLQAAEQDDANAVAWDERATSFVVGDLHQFAAIDNRLTNAESVNRLVDERDRREAHVVATDRLSGRFSRHHEELQGLRDARRALVTSVTLPVDGLGFGEHNEVTFDGRPYEQANQAKRDEVNFAIAALVNPTFRVVLLRNASAYDDASIARIAALCQLHNMQAILEEVDKRIDPPLEDTIGFYIREGRVAAVDGRAVVV